MTDQLWTINGIKDAMRQRGSHWLDPDTMRFFKCKIMPNVYQGAGGIYFVSSEAYQEEQRAYTVRKFNPAEAEIDTVGEMGAYRTASSARTAAKKLASGPDKTAMVTREEYRPVTVLDQFTYDLRRHGKETGIVLLRGGAMELIKQAARHERYMVAQCNGEYPYGRNHDSDNGHPAPVEACRNVIRMLAESCGAEGVIFGGDPRGCTCKLTFEDGFTNDFGKEGYCVPGVAIPVKP